MLNNTYIDIRIECTALDKTTFREHTDCFFVSDLTFETIDSVFEYWYREYDPKLFNSEFVCYLKFNKPNLIQLTSFVPLTIEEYCINKAVGIKTYLEDAPFEYDNIYIESFTAGGEDCEIVPAYGKDSNGCPTVDFLLKGTLMKLNLGT